jgi:hypothetical protein
MVKKWYNTGHKLETQTKGLGRVEPSRSSQVMYREKRDADDKHGKKDGNERRTRDGRLFDATTQLTIDLKSWAAQ